MHIFQLLELKKEIVDLESDREKRLYTIGAFKDSIVLTQKFKFRFFFDKDKIIIDFLTAIEQNRYHYYLCLCMINILIKVASPSNY